MSCGVGGRGGSDPMMLWLWRRPAAVADLTPSLGTSIGCGCDPKMTHKEKLKITTTITTANMNKTQMVK